MGKSLAAALLFIPVAAHSQQLLVEYRGVVSSIDRAELAEVPPYSIGDAISGTLIIDIARAPADRLAGDSQIGRYYGGSPLSDFIFGASHPPENRADGDLVVVYDDWNPPSGGAPQDGFFINDRTSGTDGDSSFVLGMQRSNLFGQLFSNDSLLQSFEAAEDEPGTTLWGYIERGFGEFWRVVDFSLDRLSVTPRVCRAP